MPTRQQDLGWVLDQLLTVEPDVQFAVAVSADGLVLAHSTGIERDDADRLAAIISGMSALSGRMCHDADGQAVIHTVITMVDRVALIIGIPGPVAGALVAVTNTGAPNIGRVGFACAELVQRLGHTLATAPASPVPHAVPTVHARQ